MTKKQYVKNLEEKGYKVINENQVSLGTLIFNICEGMQNKRKSFWLKLSKESDFNLIPDPFFYAFKLRRTVMKNMTEKEKYDKNSMRIDYFGEKLGETICNAMAEDPHYDLSSYNLGSEVYKILEQCETEKEFEIANSMLIAFCGYPVNTLIEKIQQQDKEDYIWENF